MNYRQTKKNKCLLLNIDYTPLCLVNWKKAIVWSIKSKEEDNYPIEIISYSNNTILSANYESFVLPSVAKTKYYYNIYSRDVSFSRRNLFIRDNYTCQYCGKIFPSTQLTYDHVIPKSRYKKIQLKYATTWTNVVTACVKCNRLKGNKTPQEANMILKNMPYKPTYNTKYLRWYSELHTIDCQNESEWENFINNESYFQTTPKNK